MHLYQIAIDQAVFPEGTTGQQLDVLARKALWKDGLNYLVSLSSIRGSQQVLIFEMKHGTGHGIGTFLNVCAVIGDSSSTLCVADGDSH